MIGTHREEDKGRKGGTSARPYVEYLELSVNHILNRKQCIAVNV